MRWLVGAIQDWPALCKQAYAALKPGGWLESYEPSSTFESDDGTVTDDTAVMQWSRIFIEGGKKLGRSFTLFEDETQRKAMEEAGFVGVEKRDFKVRFASHLCFRGCWLTMAVPRWNMAQGRGASRDWRIHAACLGAGC